jgi:hypothetical protein
LRRIARPDGKAAIDFAWLFRQRVAVAELKRNRLKAALPRLQAKLAQALRSEYADKWSADANKVEAKVNAVAKQVARYCEWAELITAALLEAEAVNICVPSG